MKRQGERLAGLVPLSVWGALAVLFFAMDRIFPRFLALISGVMLFRLLGLLAAILAFAELLKLITRLVLAHRKKPPVEAMMVGRLYSLFAALAILLAFAYGIGQLSAVGSFLTLFGGMLLGWSLQSPVSGVAAWALVSLMRPFRPGDRVQFPSLGLVGDVQDVGVMYTVLNQVGGSIGSEEAVGRYILVPNAMLFSQVAINYTVLQEAAYMLDEVVIRITYDSDWRAAEQVLLGAAREVTGDVIAATGMQPYIRSDLYDYGVYLRLRYQTQVQARAETAYEITKRVFHGIQETPSIDLAIPYVYSYRAGADKKEEGVPTDTAARKIRQIEIGRIHSSHTPADPKDIEQLAQSIATHGLLQPIMLAEKPPGDAYDILAGDLRFEACKLLGWKTVPAVVSGMPGSDTPFGRPGRFDDKPPL